MNPRAWSIGVACLLAACGASEGSLVTPEAGVGGSAGTAGGAGAGGVDAGVGGTSGTAGAGGVDASVGGTSGTGGAGGVDASVGGTSGTAGAGGVDAGVGGTSGGGGTSGTSGGGGQAGVAGTAGAGGSCVLGKFSAPTPLSEVNSSSLDQAPAISSDGLALYFQSNRPGGKGGHDIWTATRPNLSSPFGAPANAGPVNQVGYDMAPSISADDLTLYTLWDNNVDHRWRVAKATRASKQEQFGAAVELLGGLFSPCISTDGLTLWGAYDQGDAGLGGGEIIYVQRPDLSSKFGPVVLVPELNSSASEESPWISLDDLTILFASNRTSGTGLNDLWYSTRSSPGSSWSQPKNLTEVNSTSEEGSPSLSADGTTLVFDSNRSGDYEIYISTRSCQ